MALMARCFASVWLLWSSSRDAEPLNLNRLICLGYLRGTYDHFNDWAVPSIACLQASPPLGEKT